MDRMLFFSYMENFYFILEFAMKLCLGWFYEWY
jgi:hypothetical protein